MECTANNTIALANGTCLKVTNASSFGSNSTTHYVFFGVYNSTLFTEVTGRHRVLPSSEYFQCVTHKQFLITTSILYSKWFIQVLYKREREGFLILMEQLSPLTIVIKLTDEVAFSIERYSQFGKIGLIISWEFVAPSKESHSSAYDLIKFILFF